MITQCPKCQYERQVWDNKTHPEVCPSCGIVYRKWLAKQAAIDAAKEMEPTPLPTDGTPVETHKKSNGIFGLFAAEKR